MTAVKIAEKIFDAFGTLGWIELFGAFVVMVGCAGELWILINKLTRHIEPVGKTASRFMRSLAWVDAKMRPFLLFLKLNGRKLPEYKEQLLERFFVILVAFGVSLEFICLPFSMSEIASLNNEAGQARLEAGQANERASTNELQVAALNKEAAAERLKADKLEKQIEDARPENQPISSMSAVLTLTITPFMDDMGRQNFSLFIDKTDISKYSPGIKGRIELSSSKFLYPLSLVATNLDVRPGSPNVRVVLNMNFVSGGVPPGFWGGAQYPPQYQFLKFKANVLDEIESLTLDISPASSPAKIESGTLIVYADLRPRVFVIPTQSCSEKINVPIANTK